MAASHLQLVIIIIIIIRLSRDISVALIPVPAEIPRHICPRYRGDYRSNRSITTFLNLNMSVFTCEL